MDEFNIENQYQKYLKRVGLKESQMHPTQRIETKRAFFGACGQMLVVLREDLTDLDDDKAIETLQDMFNQVANFFIAETNKQN